MCGVAGILLTQAGSISRERLGQLAQAMADCMVYRGPDDSGVWVDDSGLCALSQRRLSIIDLSPAGHQPMPAYDGRAVITFNGEIYNYQALRSELEGRGLTFRSNSDTEVLLEAVRLLGQNAYSRIDGMFAFGLWDRAVRVLTLARDPFGEKPIYYTQQNGYFAFASELHALTVLPGFDATLDDSGIAEYFALQYVHAPRTIYRSVKKLLPGHFLTVRPDWRIDIKRHFLFQPAPEPLPNRPLDELADELESLLVPSVKSRMISDVPLGAFLSGGVDSSTVVAIMRRVLGGSVKTFSIGFDGAPESEHLAAREMAEYLGTEHRDQVLAPDVLKLVEIIGRALDEPNSDSSCLPTYLLSQFTRKHVTVALSGDGGDELFGGYGRYFTTLEESFKNNGHSNGNGSWSPGQAYYSSRILIFPDDHLAALLGNVPHETVDLLRRLRAGIDNGPASLMARMRASDVNAYMPGAVLAKVDRMAMQHSLEVRCPFLNRDIARFAETLSQDSCYSQGQGKLVLKRLAARYLPSDWLARPKQGFGLPMSIWGRGPLLEALRNSTLADDGRLQLWLGRDRLSAFARRQEENFSTYQVWSVLILEIWLRNHLAACNRAVDFVDRNSDRPANISLNGSTALNSRGPAVINFENAIIPESRIVPGLNLIQELSRFKPDKVTVLHRGEPSYSLESIPQVRAIFCAGVSLSGISNPKLRSADWTQEKFWLGDGQSNEVIAGQILVIDGPLLLLPVLALEAIMGSGGVQQVYTHQSGSWWCYSVKKLRLFYKVAGSFSPRTMSDRIQQAFGSAHAFSTRLRLGLARRVLRRWAISLTPVIRSAAVLEGGFSYHISLPHLEGLADRVAADSSDLLLFEDETLLVGHSPHEHIRQHGCGRYSHWEGGLHFSTTDQTDPRTNGREYRYLLKRRATRLVRRFGLDPRAFFFSVQDPQSRDGANLDSQSAFSKPTIDFRPSVQNSARGKPLIARRVPGFCKLKFADDLSAAAATNIDPIPRNDDLGAGVALYIGSLTAGGAERQLCYLARYMKNSGMKVTVLTNFHDSADHFHYLPFLQEHDIPVRFVSAPNGNFDIQAMLKTAQGVNTLAALARMPGYLGIDAWSLFTHLIELRPAVLHCWLDYPNIIGGVAGVMANVPEIVLSTRNYNPSHFPYIFNDWFCEWYQRLASFPRVKLIANSRTGAVSYADWMGIPTQRFQVINNGFDIEAMKSPTAGEIAALRSKLCLDADQPVVLGIFRLSPEKRPLEFIKVVDEVRTCIPNVRAIIAGVGAMQREVEKEIEKRGLQAVVTLLGRCDYVAPLYKLADLLLLPSMHEGTPNVLLEAQWFECPVVCTNVGGSPDVVLNGQSGYVCARDDIGELTARCLELLGDKRKRMEFGAAGRKLVGTSFSVQSMAEATLRVYGGDWISQAQIKPGSSVKFKDDEFLEQSTSVG